MVDPSMLALAQSGFLDLFDTLGDVQAWLKDRKGRYQWVNRAFLLNYSLEHSEEVVGRQDHHLSPMHLAEQFRMDDELVLDGRKILNRVELVGRFDHTSAWCVTNKVPIRNAQGAVVGTAGTTRPRGDTNVLDGEDARMSAVIARIRCAVSQPLDNAGLAKMVGLSIRAFERRFKALFHLTPQRYVRRMRVRMACHTLVYSARSLAEIGTGHGFCDQSHFTREFRKETGMTPREYRRRFTASTA